jgi:hypothetical protein
MSGTKPAIYLHVGRNKAGSTSLQDFFAAHTGWLAARDVRYALLGDPSGSADSLPSYKNCRELIAAFQAAPEKSILISNEMISALPLHYNIEMATDLASVNAQVILYVRPYRAWLRSSYGFDVRSGLSGRDFDAYLEHLRPKISFWPFVEIWGRLLGWNRVRVRSTDPLDLVGGDLIDDCLAAMGLSAPAGGHRVRSNITPNWMAIELLRLVVGRDEAAGWDFAGQAVAEALHEIAEEAFEECGVAGRAAEYFTHQQAQALADLYNADLDALRAHTGADLRPDDATAAPERPFLPTAAHVPQAVLRHIAARARTLRFAQLHPEAAAFIASPDFATLLDSNAGGPILVRAAPPPYIAGGPMRGESQGGPADRRDWQVMDTGVSERVITRPAAADAFRLADKGDLAAAIDVAMAVARDSPGLDLLAAMARWRRDVFSRIAHPQGPATWPPSLPDPFPEVDGIPAISAADLSADILGGAILHHGSLRVNGLITPDQARSLRAGIDRALAAQGDFNKDRPAADPGWYVPLDVPSLAKARQWSEGCGAVWTADCPPMLFEVIETLRQCGVLRHIADLMGERPALSVAKSTLRRVTPGSKHDWHQDGAFLGRDVRTVNVWLSLSNCGVDAPGMDIVGRRLPYVLQTHSHGAWFDWSVGQGMVDMLAEGGAPVLTPEFGPGDALLFDHMMLHRTSGQEGLLQDRWAIESWFFAPTNYPMDQVPLLV